MSDWQSDWFNGKLSGEITNLELTNWYILANRTGVLDNDGSEGHELRQEGKQ